MYAFKMTFTLCSIVWTVVICVCISFLGQRRLFYSCRSSKDIHTSIKYTLVNTNSV